MSDAILATGSIPKDMSICKHSASIVTGGNEILILQNGQKTESIKSDTTPTATAIAASGTTVAVGLEVYKTN